MAEIADISALLTSVSVSRAVKEGLVSSVIAKIKSLGEFPPSAAGQLLTALASAPFDQTYKDPLATSVDARLESGLADAALQ